MFYITLRDIINLVKEKNLIDIYRSNGLKIGGVDIGGIICLNDDIHNLTKPIESYNVLSMNPEPHSYDVWDVHVEEAKLKVIIDI